MWIKVVAMLIIKGIMKGKEGWKRYSKITTRKEITKLVHIIKIIYYNYDN